MEMSSICRGRAQRYISGLLSLKDRSKAEVAGCNEAQTNYEYAGMAYKD